MARSQTIIIILEELGDEDFKLFKWHLCEDKRVPRQIPYAQLVKLDRVDTSTKIKQSFGTEGGLRFMMLVLEVIDRNDLKERYSPKRSKEADADLPDITDGGETSEFRTEERWYGLEGVFPEETSDSGSQWKIYSCMAVGLFSAILGTTLLVVSTATDNWQVHRWDGNQPQTILGLWKYCRSDNPLSKNLEGEWAPALHTAGAFMVLSCMACFAAIIVSFVLRFKRSLVAGIMFLISTFIVLMVLAIYTGMIFTFFGGQDPSNWYFDWSYKLAWVAEVMILFAGTLYMCANKKRGTGPR